MDINERSRGGWTAPRKASWENRAHFIIHARTVAKRMSLCRQEIWKLSKTECLATVLRENRTIYIYCCDRFYKSKLINDRREELKYTEHRGSYFDLKSPCIANVQFLSLLRLVKDEDFFCDFSFIY